MRDEDAGAAGEQPVGGPHDERLGERVHPGRGLVEDDDGDVADEEAGEGDELLLAGGERGTAGPEQRVEAVGEPGDPVLQARAG